MNAQERLRRDLRESMRLNGDRITKPEPAMAKHDDEQDSGNRIKFDKTINLGHLLSAIAMVGGLMVSWSLMDKRVAVLEEARTAQRERDQTQDTATKEKFQEVRDALLDLRRLVEKVSDKVGAK